MSDIAPAWLVPGAPVLVYREAPSGLWVIETEVEKVNKVTFRVRDNDNVFSIDGMCKRTGQWDQPVMVVQLESAVAQKMLERYAKEKAIRRVGEAIYRWQHNHSKANRIALVRALKSVEELGADSV